MGQCSLGHVLIQRKRPLLPDGTSWRATPSCSTQLPTYTGVSQNLSLSSDHFPLFQVHTMQAFSQSCRNCVRSAGPRGGLWRKRRWSCAVGCLEQERAVSKLLCACRQHWTAPLSCSQQRSSSAADDLMHTLAEVSGQENRNEKEIPRTMIMGTDTDSIDKWRQLDEKAGFLQPACASVLQAP